MTTRVLSRSDVVALLTLPDCITAVEEAFRAIAAVLPLERVWLVDADAARARALAARLPPAHVRAGTFVAAVGADSQGKQELEPALLAGATLVVDVLEQCAEIGELQHALAAGLMTRGDVHAELADVVPGRRPGRTRDDEITVFDSTGTALQDVAAAVAVYERACAKGCGLEVAFDA